MDSDSGLPCSKTGYEDSECGDVDSCALETFCRRDADYARRLAHAVTDIRASSNIGLESVWSGSPCVVSPGREARKAL